MERNAEDGESIDALLALTREMVTHAHAAHRSLLGITAALEQTHKVLIAERRKLIGDQSNAVSGAAPQRPIRRAAGGSSTRKRSGASSGKRPRAVRPTPDPLEAARLAALEMMVNGNTSDEVADVLHETLEIDQSLRIVDEVFGRNPDDSDKAP